MSHKRYTMITLLLIALLLCYIDRVLMSLAAIAMQEEFSWTDSEKGLVLSMFFIGYLVTQVAGGLLSNRYGGRNVFLIAVLLWSLFTVLTPPAAYVSFSVLIFARFMLGFGEGAAFPSAYNLIHTWMPLRERSISIGAMSGASAVGTVSTLMLAGLIIERFGWPSVFYLFGSMGFLWSIFWLSKIPNQPIVPDDETTDEFSLSKEPTPWRILLTHRAVWTVYFASICVGSISFTLASWLPSYFIDTFGLSLTEAGMYSTLPWVAVAVATVASGRVSDARIAAGQERIKVRKWVTSIGLSLIAIGSAVLVVAGNPIIAMIIICAVFIGLGIGVVGYAPTAAELLPEHGDVFYGIAAAAGSLGAMIFVTGTGVILERTGSYNVLFLTLTGVCVITAIVYLLFGRADSLYGDTEKNRKQNMENVNV